MADTAEAADIPEVAVIMEAAVTTDSDDGALIYRYRMLTHSDKRIINEL